MPASLTPALVDVLIPSKRVAYRHLHLASRKVQGRRCISDASRSAVHAESTRRLPFRFETGISLYAKRKPRPFPPPFLSPPSASFSDALSTHNFSRDRRAYVNGDLIKGLTNGDDAAYASEQFICVNDGVGAWATRPRGHAGLWSRLVLHFWANAVAGESEQLRNCQEGRQPDPIATLHSAFEQTTAVTTKHNWLGTTTACGAQLHYKFPGDDQNSTAVPLLHVTSLGDCQVMVVRPRSNEIIYKTTEQWHWFDCPRQLGTNSPDTPQQNAVMDSVELEVGDVVLAMSDGVIDNLWGHEISATVIECAKQLESEVDGKPSYDQPEQCHAVMKLTAERLVNAAKNIALDPFAESPYMEHAIEEGLASEGGKLDDISVVAAMCVVNTEAPSISPVNDAIRQ